jgi:hypothetical protein
MMIKPLEIIIQKVSMVTPHIQLVELAHLDVEVAIPVRYILTKTTTGIQRPLPSTYKTQLSTSMEEVLFGRPAPEKPEPEPHRSISSTGGGLKAGLPAHVIPTGIASTARRVTSSIFECFYYNILVLSDYA